MSYNCKNCKFHDVNYEWDDVLEDEVEIKVCRKEHRLFLHMPFKCPYFEKYIPKPYVEQFTKCDKCAHVKQCENDGHVINCTSKMDNYEHFIRGRNAYCRKENEPFEYKKLSEIIEIVEQSNDTKLKGGKEILQKAIERFGDITYIEFIKDKAYEMFKN